jgi:hypothetical protein
MDNEYIFYTLLTLLFCYRYNELTILFNKGNDLCGQFFGNILNFFNNVDVDDLFLENEYDLNYKQEKEKLEQEQLEQEKLDQKEKKYEDKFLEDIRKMEKEYIFDESELQLLEEKRVFFLNQIIETRENKVKNHLSEIHVKLEKMEQKSMQEEDKEDNNSEDSNLEDDEYLDNEFHGSDDQLTREEIIENCLIEQKIWSSKIEEIEKNIDNEKDEQEARDVARNFIINKRIEKLENCYVMESTPQGNVLMIYDNKKSSFKFYSDNTIPYRYLEVVGRKYIKTFNCRPLYVDMEEELRLAEERQDKELKEREEKERKEKEEQDINKKEERNVVEKKSVFAKFKSYNKEGVSGRVNTGVPPKNSIPMTKEQEKEKILLKEKANRYTYEGKMVNCSFLKKVERKVVDKKYGFSFADFKKMQKQV